MRRLLSHLHKIILQYRIISTQNHSLDYDQHKRAIGTPSNFSQVQDASSPDQAGPLLRRDAEDARKLNLNELRLIMGLPTED